MNTVPRQIDSIIDVFEKHYASYLSTEWRLKQAMAEKFKSKTYVPFVSSGLPGAVGLRRDLSLRVMGENQQPCCRLDEEVTRSIRIEELSIEYILSLINHPLENLSSDSDFIDKLHFLLCLTDLLSAGVDTASLRVASATRMSGSFTSSMHGKLGAKDATRLFSFHTQNWVKIECSRVDRDDDTLEEKFDVILAVNVADRAAYIKRREHPATNMVKFTNEIILVFNSRPKLTMHMIQHPARDGIQGGSWLTYLQQTYQTDAKNIQKKINATPTTLEEDSKLDLDTQSPTMYFLNKVFPLVRYARRSKGGSRARIDTIAYDSYLPCFVQYAHDIGRLQYVYSVLSAVGAALCREIGQITESIIKKPDLNQQKWTSIVQDIQYFAESFKDPGNEWSLKTDITFMAYVISQLYSKVVEITPVNTIQKQLQQLYCSGCELNSAMAKRSASEFGHLLTVYLFYHAPIHVVIHKGLRLESTPERTFFQDAQKLIVESFEFEERKGWRAYGRRWSMSTTIRSKRKFPFDLKSIMCPNTKFGDYWQKNFDIATEAPDRYVADPATANRLLIPVDFEATHAFKVALDIPFPNIMGVTLINGKEVGSKKHRAKGK